MQLADFDYDLPQSLIAQHPPARRGDSRLMQVGTPNVHRTFSELPGLLRPGDLLVVNNTRVIKARLYGVKDTGGNVEILLERVIDEVTALCQVKASKSLKYKRNLTVGEHQIEVHKRLGQFYILRFDQPVLEVLDIHGHMPLPPYIERADEDLDVERYQTVFNRHPGAIAAPTAGLHFDDSMLKQLEAMGVARTELTLHVGAGTFAPIRGDIATHQMHKEWVQLDADAVSAINAARERGGRVVAVGTTVVRCLEAVATRSAKTTKGAGGLQAWSGETDLFITPGFEFKVVDALITNFHLPRSTLLMLVCAFAGFRPVMAAYREAVANEYQFFSYGDAMLLERERRDV
jgi:S-adenosylmethionine:tRNA ribosyltransferase-isomerase